MSRSSRVAACVACLAIAVAPVATRAQDAPPPSAGATADPMDEARERLARGEGLYDAGDHEGALAEFRAIDRLLEGHAMRPLAVWNMARAAERLFRYDEAIALYERYVAAPEPGARYVETAREKLATLASLLGTLEIEVRFEPPAESAAELWIDAHEVEGPRVRVPGGRHVVEARGAGRLSARREVEIVAGRSERVVLVLSPATRGLEPAPFWASAAASAIGLVGVVVLGPLALVERDEMASCTASLACQLHRGWADPASGGPTAAFDAARARVQGLAVSADVSLGLAAAGAISALVLGFLTDFSGAPSEPAALVFGVGPDQLALSWGASW
jgi:tetratricopeptide (TPR) repeat protein